MYVLELAFDDNPERLDYRPAHRDKMAALTQAGKVLASGPWADESGALLAFNVATREEAEVIIADDPYFTAPGVTVVALREWKTVAVHPALTSHDGVVG